VKFVLIKKGKKHGNYDERGGSSLTLCSNLSDRKSRYGRAIAQEVSRRLLSAAVRVRAQVRSCGICGGQSGIGADFLRVLLFPMSIHNPPNTPKSPSSIIWGWYNKLNSGRNTKGTQSHPTPRN
jgi:hypothetical protein